MIAGLEEITAGELSIDGQRVNDVPPSERGLAMVFQSYALYPHMSVGDNMGFSLRLAGVSKEERNKKVGEAARVLHLDKLLDRKPKDLSGGQRQRVAIGRAIVRKPRVFLFDEPLSNLDAALRVQMRIELARLHDELKATMIYVTHDQVEAMTMADKIVVLQAGVVEQAGSPLELYHHPRNIFVAGFIGSPKMNFLPGKVTAVDGASATVQLAGGSSITVPCQPGGLKAGASVTVGVRPEHLRPAEIGRDLRRGDGGRAARRRDLHLHPDRRQRDAGHPGRRRDPDPGAREDHGQARPADLPPVRFGRPRRRPSRAPPAGRRSPDERPQGELRA